MSSWRTKESSFGRRMIFLSDKYGERNTVAAWVHKDETIPHFHFCRVPVVPDEKQGGGHVSTHDCVTRKNLKTFHTELSKHIERALGYESEILNEATRDGNRSVAKLKRETAVKRLKALNNDMESNIEDLRRIRQSDWYALMFDDLRLDEQELQKLKTDTINALCPLYHSTNLTLLNKFFRKKTL